MSISVAISSCAILGGAVTTFPDAETLPALGLTECDPIWGPISWVNVDVLDTPDEKGTVLHERKHAEQVRRFPNCGSFGAWYRANVLEAEAEAFCQEIYDDVRKERFTYDAAIVRYGRWLAGYVHGTPPAHTEQLLRKTCGQVSR